MKKSIIFLLLATACLFTACEQPEGPQSLIGHWKWLVTIGRLISMKMAN